MWRTLTCGLLALSLAYCAPRTRRADNAPTFVVVVQNRNWYAETVRVICESGQPLYPTVRGLTVGRTERATLPMRCPQIRLHVQGLGRRAWTSELIPIEADDTVVLEIGHMLRYTAWYVRPHSEPLAMRYYLSGPMSGIDGFNFRAFHAAATMLRAEGHDIVSPAEMDEADDVPPGERPWAEYLRRDLAALLQCDGVIVLPGWQDSRGASFEALVAETLDMPVLVYPHLTPPRTETVCQEAQRVVNGARRRDYGHPLDNHTRTAEGWRWWIRGRHGADVPLDAEDVCFMNDVQKSSRAMNRMIRDTLVDKAGYMGNVEMIVQERRRRGSSESQGY